MATTDLGDTRWVKSSYSNNGGTCVEVALATARWRKSNHDGQGGECVEGSAGFQSAVPVRDSTDPEGPALVFPASAWHAFVAGVQAGEFGSV
ncbi:DUF397 domain-containing protein [Kitasatospora purpeofusca]|uniref:DUF397 domain-containing protein n=1 Tax=Kitasatospora purpeofusca TaxID=67352 RepID=UPI0036D3B627